jgi:hypothetical protein
MKRRLSSALSSRETRRLAVATSCSMLMVASQIRLVPSVKQRRLAVRLVIMPDFQLPWRDANDDALDTGVGVPDPDGPVA